MNNKKIDLHMHTKYSDGNSDVKTILTMAENEGLSVISITDHDCCKAYFDLENENLRNLFSGSIKTGIEITTSFDGVRIELLVFDFQDYSIIDGYFTNATNSIDWEKIMIIERKELLRKLNSLSIKYPNEFADNLLIDRYESKMYEEILKSNDNKFLEKQLEQFYCQSGSEFYRKCIANPESPFYANYGKYRPRVEDIIKLIHENGGLVFLAHPFGYELTNPKEFMKKLYDTHKNLDGVECYYYGFTEEQINYIQNFANERNLLVSGGSDFHDTEDRPNYIGKCMFGNSIIPIEILSNWNKEKSTTKTHI